MAFPWFGCGLAALGLLPQIGIFGIKKDLRDLRSCERLEVTQGAARGAHSGYYWTRGPIQGSPEIRVVLHQAARNYNYSLCKYEYQTYELVEVLTSYNVQKANGEKERRQKWVPNTYLVQSAPTVTAQRIEINGVECGDFASSLPMKTFQTIQNDSIDAFSKYTDTDKGNRRPQGGGNNNNVVVNVNSGGDRFANDSIGEGSRVTKGYRHIFTGLENGDQITVIGHYNGQRFTHDGEKLSLVSFLSKEELVREKEESISFRNKLSIFFALAGVALGIYEYKFGPLLDSDERRRR